MTFGRLRSTMGTLTLLAAGVAASGADLPQLGKSPTKDVVAAMTREEKVSLVVGAGMRRPGASADRQGPVVGETAKGVPGAAGTTVPISRLGIPAIVLADGPAGLRIQPKREGDTARTYYCTAFPIETLLASSWDTELVERVGRAMGNETREYGVDVLLGPALNTHRNPLGGRNFEYYSEDPLVSGRMAAAMVKGVQSQGVGTSPKHYVANDHEWNRNVIDVKVSERALREIYLRGFEIVVREARPWTVMSSYNKVNGTYTSESPALLTGVLRDDWGFDGLVMTDWFGGRDAVAQMKAGNDLLMPGTARQQEAILAALASGALPEEVLDRNVTRILEIIRRSPSFLGTPHSDAPDLKAHAQVARDAAAQGMVLLRNEGGTLPLRAPAKLALFGNTSYRMITGGTGSGDVNEAYTVSLVEGLTAAGFTVDAALADAYGGFLAEEEKKQPAPARPFQPRPPVPERAVAADEIARAAREADVALFALGRNSGEFRDRVREGDFELTAVEKTLIQDLATAFHAHEEEAGRGPQHRWRDRDRELARRPRRDPPRLAAGTGVRPRDRRRARRKDASLGQARHHLPGEVGGRPVVGQLPGQGAGRPRPERAAGSFPGRPRGGGGVHRRHLRRLPPLRHEGREDRLPLRLRPLVHAVRSTPACRLSDVGVRGELKASVTVKNAGSTPGREVVQLYVSAPGKALPKPALELRGFAKTKTLKPGESETLVLHPDRPRSRLVRRGLVLVARRGGDLHGEDRGLVGGHPPVRDLHEGRGRDGRRDHRAKGAPEVTHRRALAFLAGAACGLATTAAAANVSGRSTPSVTADGAGAFATGRYRNLFAEAGRTEKPRSMPGSRGPGSSSSRATRRRSVSTSRAGRTRMARSRTSPTSSTRTSVPRECRTA